MSVESVTAAWLQQLTKIGGLYSLAAVSRAGLLDAYYAGIIAQYEALQGGTLLFSGTARVHLLLRPACLS